jgi:hypothetical protein
MPLNMVNNCADDVEYKHRYAMRRTRAQLLDEIKTCLMTPLSALNTLRQFLALHLAKWPTGGCKRGVHSLSGVRGGLSATRSAT